jgi:hypothetical protein
MRNYHYFISLLLLSSFGFFAFDKHILKNKTVNFNDSTMLKVYAIANHFLLIKDYAQASKFYDRAEDSEFKSCLFYLRSGIAHTLSAKTDEDFLKANVILTKAKNLKPKTAKWNDYILENQLTYRSKGYPYTEFYPVLKWVSMEYNYSYIFYYRGLAKYNLNDFYGAQSDLKLFHTTGKDSSSFSCYMLADSYARTKQYNSAIKYFSFVIKNPGQDESIVGQCYINRGKLYYNQNKKTLGCLDFSKALELGESNAQTLIKEHCQ